MGNEKGLVPDEEIGRHEDLSFASRVNQSDIGYWGRPIGSQDRTPIGFRIHRTFCSVLSNAINGITESIVEYDGVDDLKEVAEFELMVSTRPEVVNYTERFKAESFADSQPVGTIRLSKIRDLYECLGIRSTEPFESLAFVMDTDLTSEVVDEYRTLTVPVGQNRYLVVKPSYGELVIVSHVGDDYEWCHVRDALATDVEASDRLLYSTVFYMVGGPAEYFRDPKPVKTSIVDIRTLIHEVNLALTKDAYAEVLAKLPYDNVRTFLDSVAGVGVQVSMEHLWLSRGLAAIRYDYGNDLAVYKPQT